MVVPSSSCFLTRNWAILLLAGYPHTSASHSTIFAPALLRLGLTCPAFVRASPPEMRARFALLHHSEMITASALLFDYGTPTAKILVDQKLYGVGREGSFGMELKPSMAPNSLYERVTGSYLTIRRRAYSAQPTAC